MELCFTKPSLTYLLGIEQNTQSNKRKKQQTSGRRSNAIQFVYKTGKIDKPLENNTRIEKKTKQINTNV